MSWRRQLAKVKHLFGIRDELSDLEEEIAVHLKLEAQENRDAGMSEEAAALAARRRFGNTTLTSENSRDTWKWQPLEALLQDVRFGIRQLLKNPGFAAIAVLTLALGIGATTAIFSVVHSVLLRPLPFQDPDNLVQLFETEAAPGEFPLSGADYLDWQAQNRTLEMSLYSWGRRMSAGVAAAPEAAMVTNTQANFFQLLGVSSYLGRTFLRGEDVAGKNRVAILSFGFWERRYTGDKRILGETITIDSEKYTIVGVMPRWFQFGGICDVWTPLDMRLQALGPHGNHNWNAIGRLREGFTLAAARRDLLAISKRLEKQFPDTNNRVYAIVTPLKENLVGYTRTPLLVLLGAVLLVLFIACVNVANLQLVRASVRHREMAIRTSLGAGRWRMIRQLLTENVILSLAGAVLGTLGAWWCVRMIEGMNSLPIPRANSIEINSAVLLFTVTISVVAGLLFGLAPALQSSEFGTGEELKAGSQSVVGVARTRGLLRDGLVIAEVAITLALLAGAGLLIKSFLQLRAANIGINPHNLLTMAVSLPESNYPNSTKRREFFHSLLARVQTVPGIESASMSLEIPLLGGSNGTLKPDTQTDPNLATQLVGWNYITPEYFQTLGIPLVKGRSLTEGDLQNAVTTAERLDALFRNAKGTPPKIPADITFVAVISQTAARTFWPNQNVLGRSFHWNDVKVTVIGVVADVSEYGIRHKPMPQAYFPFPIQLGDNGYARLTVRTRISPKSAIAPIRAEVQALDNTLAVLEPRTMHEVIANDTQDTSFQALLLGVFATLALLLAAVGLYGVMSYLVSQRTREIGIRMAIGARSSNVLRLILGQGAKLMAIGLLLGLLAAFGLSRLLSRMLYGVAPDDPATLVLVSLVLAIVGLAAYYIPARRATKIDPIRALRFE
jgi:putative ABC transport system permease protein